MAISELEEQEEVGKDSDPRGEMTTGGQCEQQPAAPATSKPNHIKKAKARTLDDGNAVAESNRTIHRDGGQRRQKTPPPGCPLYVLNSCIKHYVHKLHSRSTCYTGDAQVKQQM